MERESKLHVAEVPAFVKWLTEKVGASGKQRHEVESTFLKLGKATEDREAALNANIDEWKQRCQELESKLHNAESVRRDLEHFADELIDRVGEAEKKRQAAESELLRVGKATEDREAVLDANSDEWKQRCQELETKLHKAESARAELEKFVDELTEKRDAAESTLLKLAKATEERVALIQANRDEWKRRSQALETMLHDATGRGERPLARPSGAACAKKGASTRRMQRPAELVPIPERGVKASEGFRKLRESSVKVTAF